MTRKTNLNNYGANIFSKDAYATWYSFSISSLGRICIHGAQKLGLEAVLL